MTSTTTRRPAVVIARRASAELFDRLGVAPLDVARPGALGLPVPPVLLRTADGWVHPGPPTAWGDFSAMVESLLEGNEAGARRSPRGSDRGAPGAWPDVSTLSAEAIDREAGEWMLPAAAVRATPAAAPAVAAPSRGTRVDGARVLVLGSAWAAPLSGALLARLGADVVRATNPRRPDPFPLRDALTRGQREVPFDLADARDRDRFAALLERVDLLIDATTPRVLRNVGLGGPHSTAIVRISAFAAGERPGYGIAAEARGGWAARHDPPRLGRASVADPVAGLLAALAAVDLLTAGRRPASAHVSLEGATGHLLAVERREG
jgi:hypothetical protein